MIYNNFEPGEIISILSLGLICAVVFLISGIVILVTKVINAYYYHYHHQNN